MEVGTELSASPALAHPSLVSTSSPSSPGVLIILHSASQAVSATKFYNMRRLKKRSSNVAPGHVNSHVEDLGEYAT
jgi:hypothetical protein